MSQALVNHSNTTSWGHTYDFLAYPLTHAHVILRWGGGVVCMNHSEYSIQAFIFIPSRNRLQKLIFSIIAKTRKCIHQSYKKKCKHQFTEFTSFSSFHRKTLDPCFLDSNLNDEYLETFSQKGRQKKSCGNHNTCYVKPRPIRFKSFPHYLAPLSVLKI